MSPSKDASPLSPAWVELIDHWAPRLLGPDDRIGAGLVDQVGRLSRAYTRRREEVGAASQAWAARLRFFLPRDLPKIQGPLAELAWADALPSARTWRVLDLGSGLGTTSLGVAAFAQQIGVERLSVEAIEQHGPALDVFRGIARAASEAGLTVPIDLSGRAADLEGGLRHRTGAYDLVVLGLTLNELYPQLPSDRRLDALEGWLREALGWLAEGGSLIVLEPASREHARDLQRLRDRLPEAVFAPCLRQGPCPLLVRERDWCHSQLPFALPEGLAEIAKASGLRAGRLTYAYLTLRADGRRLLTDPAALRFISNPLPSKGKTERDGCGESGLIRLRLLDRDRTEERGDWMDAERGTLVRLASAPTEEAMRVRADTFVERLK